LRGSKAKALRRQVYGEFSQREPRKYGCHKFFTFASGLTVPDGAIFCTGRRAEYQWLKKAA